MTHSDDVGDLSFCLVNSDKTSKPTFCLLMIKPKYRINVVIALLFNRIQCILHTLIWRT